MITLELGLLILSLGRNRIVKEVKVKGDKAE